MKTESYNVEGIEIEVERISKEDTEAERRKMAYAFKMIREQSGMTRKDFSDWLGIPYRTMQEWELGRRVMPEYVLRYQAAERAGGDFFILPSSIHEVLIVPDNGEMGLKDLEAMVKEVNATQVAPADKLTDSVYHYDSKDKIFELGEKFVQRQAEKEAEHAEERGEKSVLGDLKAKKEEVAKTPKKETIDKGAKAKGGEAL